MEEPVEYNTGNKEEKRILIHTIRPECKFREMHETTAGGLSWVDFMCGKSTIKNLECDEKCFEQCEWKELIGMTRTEAIEKMARAIFKWDNLLSLNYTFDEIMEHKRNLYLELAGTVLNALLEEGK